MHDFTPLPALIGGALIGLSASLLLVTHGTVAGISGIYAGALRRGTEDRASRVAFLVGLLVAGVVARAFAKGAFETTWNASPAIAIVAGLLVGFGTQLGSGCTSGHGVCGISRLSVRSLVATLTFMATGAAAVFIARHLFGASR
jgi:uncharacterized membrane protein YedE/YeeE